MEGAGKEERNIKQKGKTFLESVGTTTVSAGLPWPTDTCSE